MRYNVCAVVVTYNPDIAVFADVIAKLDEQVNQIIIVDNHSNNCSDIEAVAQRASCRFVATPENMGIAHAQNVGVGYGLEQNAQYILLMDQDTILPEGAVDDLYDICRDLEAKGVKVGSIGHAYRDTHDGKVSIAARAQGHRLIRRAAPPDAETVLEADFVIASGSLIPIPALQEVGLMDETLFIDLVDVEWGLRALSRGYRNFQSLRKIMTHTLGNGRINLFGKSISLHTPIRDYYVIRNSILMLGRDYVGLAWKLYFFRRLFPFFIVFGFFANHKMTRLHFMTRGLIDGVLKRGGRYRQRPA